MERKMAKLVGWDKGSLTEEQTKGTVTTTILLRKKYTKQTEKCTEQLSPPNVPRAPKPQPVLSRPVPPPGAQHDGT